jgi:hypothetical protein
LSIGGHPTSDRLTRNNYGQAYREITFYVENDFCDNLKVKPILSSYITHIINLALQVVVVIQKDSLFYDAFIPISSSQENDLLFTFTGKFDFRSSTVVLIRYLVIKGWASIHRQDNQHIPFVIIELEPLSILETYDLEQQLVDSHVFVKAMGTISNIENEKQSTSYAFHFNPFTTAILQEKELHLPVPLPGYVSLHILPSLDHGEVQNLDGLIELGKNLKLTERFSLIIQ